MKIQLKGVKNVRDFSEFGYGQFIRSAHLHTLTAADAEKLTGRYGVKTVIDLRTPQEVKEKPDRTLPGVRYIHIPLFEKAIPGVSHEEETEDLTDKIPDMPLLYHLLATEEPYVSRIREVMAIILDPRREGAVLWHCTEGKDRCGIISALFLLTRGVEEQKVMDDYLYTNRVNRLKAWKYFLLIVLSRRGVGIARRVKDAFLARREYLEPVMEELRKIAADL